VKNYQHRAASRLFSGAVAGKKRLLQGELRMHILYFVLVLLYFIFTCIVLSKIQKICSYYSCYFCWSIIVLLYHAFYQWLVSLKLNLFGKMGSRKSNKNIMRNTACHKKGDTYGNKLTNCISLLEMCALLIMLLIALINLVAVGGINTSLFNVSIMMMLPYLLILMGIMTL
jgi:hypothetical protein